MAAILGLMVALRLLGQAASLPLEPSGASQSLEAATAAPRSAESLSGHPLVGLLPFHSDADGDVYGKVSPSLSPLHEPGENRKRRRATYDGYHAKHLVEISPLRKNKKKEGKTPLTIILTASDGIEENQITRRNNRHKQKIVKDSKHLKVKADSESREAANRAKKSRPKAEAVHFSVNIEPVVRKKVVKKAGKLEGKASDSEHSSEEAFFVSAKESSELFQYADSAAQTSSENSRSHLSNDRSDSGDHHAKVHSTSISNLKHRRKGSSERNKHSLGKKENDAKKNKQLKNGKSFPKLSKKHETNTQHFTVLHKKNQDVTAEVFSSAKERGLHKPLHSESVTSSVQENTKEDVTKEVTSEGVTNEVTKEDVTKEVTKEVTLEGVTKEVTLEGVTNEVTKEDVTKEVTKEDVTMEVTLEGVTKEVTKEDVTKEVTLEGVTKEVTKEDVTKEVTKEDVTKEVTLEGVTKEVTKEDVSKEVTKEHVTKEVTLEGVTKEVTKEDVTKEVTLEGVTREVTKEDVTKEVTKEDVTKEVTLEGVTKEVTKENVTKEVTLEGVTREVTKEDITKELTKEDVTKEVTKENLTHENTKGQNTPLRNGSRRPNDKSNIVHAQIHKHSNRKHDSKSSSVAIRLKGKKHADERLSNESKPDKGTNYVTENGYLSISLSDKDAVSVSHSKPEVLAKSGHNEKFKNHAKSSDVTSEKHSSETSSADKSDNLVPYRRVYGSSSSESFADKTNHLQSSKGNSGDSAHKGTTEPTSAHASDKLGTVKKNSPSIVVGSIAHNNNDSLGNPHKIIDVIGSLYKDLVLEDTKKASKEKNGNDDVKIETRRNNNEKPKQAALKTYNLSFLFSK